MNSFTFNRYRSKAHQFYHMTFDRDSTYLYENMLILAYRGSHGKEFSTPTQVHDSQSPQRVPRISEIMESTISSNTNEYNLAEYFKKAFQFRLRYMNNII